MKKSMLFLLIGLMSFSLSCGRSGGGVDPGNPGSSVEENTTEDIAIDSLSKEVRDVDGDDQLYLVVIVKNVGESIIHDLTVYVDLIFGDTSILLSKIRVEVSKTQLQIGDTASFEVVLPPTVVVHTQYQKVEFSFEGKKILDTDIITLTSLLY